MRESRLQRCAPINALTPSRPGHRDKIASNDLEISRGIIARIISMLLAVLYRFDISSIVIRETKRFGDAEKKGRKERGMRVRSFRCSLEHRVFIYERKFDRGGT